MSAILSRPQCVKAIIPMPVHLKQHWRIWVNKWVKSTKRFWNCPNKTKYSNTEGVFHTYIISVCASRYTEPLPLTSRQPVAASLVPASYTSSGHAVGTSKCHQIFLATKEFWDCQHIAWLHQTYQECFGKKILNKLCCKRTFSQHA